MGVLAASRWGPSRSPVARAPGYPLVGAIPFIRRDPLGFFDSLARDYGDAVSYKIGPHKVLMLNRPEYVQHVLQRKFRNYPKSRFYEPIRPIFGDGLITAEGDEWVRQRRSVTKNFHGSFLSDLCTHMSDAGSAMVSRWANSARSGEPVNVSNEMAHVTLDIVMRGLFGIDLAADHDAIYRELSVLLREAERRIWSLLPLPLWVPTPNNIAAVRAKRKLDAYVQRIVEERRESRDERDDLLAILIATEGDENLIRDQVRSFIMAGHETTANATSWLWYELARRPDVEARMRAEIETVLGGRTPRFPDLSELVYTRMVFNEVMRVHPPVWTISRVAIDDDEVLGIEIPRGTTVMVSPYAIHRRHKLWPDPEVFDPERFTPAMETARHPYAFLPFGGGPRTCVGNRFAEAEALILAVIVLQRFQMKLVPDQEIEPEPMITLRPRTPVNMALHAV